MSKEERVTFPNLSGQHLVGTLHDTGSKACVLLCHGLASDRNDFVFPQLAAALAARGLSSLRFDFRGNGESGGVFKYANLQEEKEDIRSACEWLTLARGKRTAALVGHSKGGSSVMTYAGAHNDIPVLVNIAGRFNTQQGVKERFGEDIEERMAREGSIDISWRVGKDRTPFKWAFTKQDLDERKATDMSKACKGVHPTAKVLNIHGDADATIDISDSHAFHTALQHAQSTQVTVAGASHDFADPQHAHQLITAVVDFIVKSCGAQEADGITA